VMMAGLLRAYVHHCHRRHGFVGHRWQGRYQSPAVEGRDDLLSCGRYIERNPVAAGVPAQPWEYRWSLRPASLLLLIFLNINTVTRQPGPSY
jgi:hypothetical protein